MKWSVGEVACQEFHIADLPPSPRQRKLGDKYVGEEFRKHKAEPEGGEFLPKFFLEWEKYVGMLEQQSPQTGFGAPLDAQRHGELNDEQKVGRAEGGCVCGGGRREAGVGG